MSLTTGQDGACREDGACHEDGASEEYEAIAPGPDEPGPVVFLRRSARPSRRAVLHVHDLAGSLAPADLARWYNERGFHFYVTDVDRREAAAAAGRRHPAQALGSCFATLDGARRYLRERAGIDAVILSAQGAAAVAAAHWCDARKDAGPADALILSDPDFGRGRRARLDIACPVLVIAPGGPEGGGRAAIRLGQHVTWLHLDDDAEERRRLFDEMGRWLGAYMYGKVRDRLL